MHPRSMSRSKMRPRRHVPHPHLCNGLDLSSSKVCLKEGVDGHAKLQDLFTRLPSMPNQQVKDPTPRASAKNQREIDEQTHSPAPIPNCRSSPSQLYCMMDSESAVHLESQTKFRGASLGDYEEKSSRQNPKKDPSHTLLDAFEMPPVLGSCFMDRLFSRALPVYRHHSLLPKQYAQAKCEVRQAT